MSVKQKEIGVFKKMQKHICKQEIISDATFKAWPFSSDFNFICKDGRDTAAICEHYCPLVVNPAITNCCKELHLEYGRVRKSVFENVAMHKNKSGFAWKPVFFLIIWNVATFIESHCFSLLLFTVWWNIFDQTFRVLLPLSLDPVNQWLFKVKITCKRVNFIKP